MAGFYSASRDRVMPPLRGLLLLRRVHHSMRALSFCHGCTYPPDLNATLLYKLGRDRAIRIRAVQRRLCVALDEEVYASAQPFEVGTRRHASECRAVELARRGLCMCGCRLLRPLDAAAARQNLMEPQNLALQ